MMRGLGAIFCRYAGYAAVWLLIFTTLLLAWVVFNAYCVFYGASLSIVKPGPAYPPTKGEVWPKPQQQIKEQTYFKLSPSVFKFTEKGETCDILKNAIDRYTAVLRNTHHIAWRHSKKLLKHIEPQAQETSPDFKGTLEELQIDLSRPCEFYPYLDMDEKYSLNISATSTLNSDSIWGILRGMETFVQLFYFSNGYKDVLINTTQINDFPRYTYRGLLIDTSRHYLTVANILRTLDAMEMNKMNVLHWHIVDDQSFPYQSEKFPQLSEQGAYDPSMIYTKMNIHQIVTYARDRGIRVLPEFDIPGHTRSWGVAYPAILTKCYQGDKVIGLGPMDPTNNVTYKLIGDLFREVQGRFPDKYFHLGGDEVAMDCWLSNPKILGFMSKHNMDQPGELHAYFMKKVLPLLGQKSKAIVWQEVFIQGVTLPTDVIVQVWKTVGAEGMINVLAVGHKLIYSAPWYLEHLTTDEDLSLFYRIDPRRMFYKDSLVNVDNIAGGEVCMWGEFVEVLEAGHKVIYSSAWYLDYMATGGDWEKFYSVDPRQMIPTNRKELNLDDILGGEACMWGESVDDRNLISRVWPRASAVAEKLWSAEQPRFYFNRHVATEVNCRLEEHACRMNRRGVHAQPPTGPGFCIGGI